MVKVIGEVGEGKGRRKRMKILIYLSLKSRDSLEKQR